MKKRNYSKYSEVNTIYNEIINLEKRLYKVTKVMNDINLRKKDFYYVLQQSQSNIMKKFHEDVDNAKKKYEENLKRARYIKTDVYRMETEHRLKVEELNDECVYKLEQSKIKQLKDMEKLDYNFQLCVEEKNKLEQKIKELEIQLNEQWSLEKENIKEITEKLDEKIKKAKVIFKAKSIELKKEAADTKRDLIKEYYEEHTNEKFVKIRLFFVNFRRLTKVDKDLYQLYVSLNEIKLSLKRNMDKEKQGILKLRKDRLLSMGVENNFDFTLIKQKFQYYGTKITSSWFIDTLKKSFFFIVPIVLITSFFLVLNKSIFSTSEGSLFHLFNLNQHSKNILEEFDKFNAIIPNIFYSFVSLFIAGIIAYNLSNKFKVPSVLVTFLSMVCFLIMKPEIFVSSVSSSSHTNGIDKHEALFGTNYMLLSIVVAFLSVMFFSKISQYRKLQIWLPEGTPNIISKSFKFIIPTFIVFSTFLIVSFSIYELTINTISDKNYLAAPDIPNLINLGIKKMLNISGSIIDLGKATGVVVVQQLLWYLGIDPIPVLKTVVGESWHSFASNDGIFSYQYLQSFVNIGGAGCGLSLIIAIICFSKRKDIRVIAIVSIIPSIFNIDIPLVYGLPILFNPILFLPFLFIPLILLWISYYLSQIGVIQIINGNIDSSFAQNTISFIISLSSSKSWWNCLWTILFAFVAFVAYSPFIFFWNSIEKKEMLANIIREKYDRERENWINNAI